MVTYTHYTLDVTRLEARFRADIRGFPNSVVQKGPEFSYTGVPNSTLQWVLNSVTRILLSATHGVPNSDTQRRLIRLNRGSEFSCTWRLKFNYTGVPEFSCTGGSESVKRAPEISTCDESLQGLEGVPHVGLIPKASGGSQNFPCYESV